MLKNLLLKGRVICGLVCCLLLSLAASAQTRITGKVIGADDRQPVIGASVRLKGTTFGTVTDVNGNFSISAAQGQVLTISYIGYQSQDVTIGASATVSVTLRANQSSLNEVVVTGYTTQRKKDISGSVATVNVTAAKQLATASSDQLLQGQAAGVNVVTQGAPGSDAQVYIRGIGNFQSSQPLYVIDGVQTNSMRDINPNDIESISVLKDAVGTAQYGVAGGNGVVLITTRRGKGKSTITYDAYYGTQRPLPGNPLNLVGADEFTQILNLADPTNGLLINGKYAEFGYQGNGGAAKGVANSGNPAVNPNLYKFDLLNPSNDYLIQRFATGQGTDWFHEVFKPAPITSHSLSASGANEKNNYFISFNYLNQNGTLLNSFYKRYSGRANTTFNIKDHIRIGETAQVYYTSTPGGYTNLDEGNAVSYIYRIQPNIPVYDIGGNFGGTYAGSAQLGNANNPVAIRERVLNNTNKNWEVIATGFAEVDFLKHFTARTSYNIRFNNYYYTTLNLNPYESAENHNVAASYAEGSGFNSTYNWTNTILYKQVFGKHNVQVLGGYEQQDNYNRFINGTGINPFSVENDVANITNTQLANRQVNSGPSYQPTSRQSYFARLDYQYNDKYILGATVRRDGYSAFINKFGTFPAVSLAWRISQEDFMKRYTWINDLKIRGSYGAAAFAGNTPGANSSTLYTAGAGKSYYPIDGSLNTPLLGFYNLQIGNRTTTWETDKTFNIGFDAALFNNKLDLTAEYFVKTSSNFLYQLTLPATIGGAIAPFINLGEIKNRGFEIAATYHLRPSNDLSFDIGANISAYKNRITDLPFNVPSASSRIGTIVRNELGHSVGEFFGYKQIGYFRDAADVAASATQAGAAPGAFKFEDTNRDGVITDADRTYIGNPNPKFNYGLNLSARYKNFDVLAVLYGVYGNKVFNYVKYFTEFYTTFPGGKNKDLLYNSWSPNNLNPATVDPRLPSSFSTDQTVNSYYVESGSFLKMRTLQIGYTFSPSLLKAVSIDRLRIYLQGANLFTITKYKGLDPEIQAIPTDRGGANAIGVDYGNYPNNERRYLIGINLSF